MIANSEDDLDGDMKSVLESTPLYAGARGIRHKRKVEETDLAKVVEIQNRQWRIVPAAMGGWTIQANGFDVAGTYDLENAQAILANALERQTLLTQVHNLIEQNKRLESAVKSYLRAATKAPDKI